MKYWLCKSDPETYSWDEFVRDGSTMWDGVRNYEARNNMRHMKLGDKVLIYHSQTTRTIVGLSEVSREALPDPTADDDKWVAVELTAKRTLAKPLSLAEIKSIPDLQNIALVKRSRLSIMPLTKKEFDLIIELTS